MGISVKIDRLLYEQAKNAAKAENRTIAGQIEFWARLGRAAHQAKLYHLGIRGNIAKSTLATM